MNWRPPFPDPTRFAHWRPPLPGFVIDAFLRRGRGAPLDADTPRRPLNFTLPAIERTRTNMLRTQAMADPAPRHLQRSTIELPHCTAERLTLPNSRPGHTILYFHGGGYLRGSTTTHAGALARFMTAARCEAVSVDYRLAPEHQFPTWLDDAVDAYRRLLDDGHDPAKIALGGDSAGGAIVLGLVQRLAQEGLPQPACAFVVSPWADLSSSGPSHVANAGRDVMFHQHVIADTATWVAEQAGADPRDPLLSPAFGEFDGAPPLRIDVSAVEVLRSDSDMVAASYRAAGREVQVVEHASAPHAWTAIGVLRAAHRTAREIGEFVDQHISA